MKNLLSKEIAEKLIRRENNILPIMKVKDGFIATDFKKTYLLGKDYKNENDENQIWAHNQPWVVYEVDDVLKLPIWFSKELYNKATEKTLASLPDEGQHCYKSIMPIIEGDGFCYSPAHNQYTGDGWYANNAVQAIIHCLLDWTPVWDISLTPMELKFDNGEMGFTSKGIQIWKRDYEYSLSFFSSRAEKKMNAGCFTEEAIQLVKYATDAKKSKWRLHKRWAQLLKFKGKITEFENLSEKYIPNVTGHVVEAVFVATAGEYFLVRFEWGGLFGGEGDTGEDFYFFEDEDEFLEKLKELTADK